MHYSINSEEIKTEIEKLGHTATNIRNTKQYRTKLPLSMFFGELKPALNNKDIFNVEYVQQCNIKFELPKQKGYYSMCKLCNEQKLLPSQTKMCQMRR
jgi:hypothetical protein